MSYNLTLYNNSSANNSLSKNLTQIQNLSVDFKEKNNNLQELDLIIYLAQQTRIRLINYATMFYNGITLKYFVKIYPETLGNNRYKIHLTLDPLTTYKDDILNLNCIIKRNTNKYNLYVPDDRLPTLKKTQIQTKAFNHTFVPYSSTVITLVGSSYD